MKLGKPQAFLVNVWSGTPFMVLTSSDSFYYFWSIIAGSLVAIVRQDVGVFIRGRVCTYTDLWPIDFRT